ncbi:MAG: hypothetical protein LBU29_04525 [Endomicrobium sp.]|nr:hypothetical protein [Endomicrobium sp.]
MIFLMKCKNVGKRLAIVDASVLIDGRICDIANTGFLSLDLIIPSFVIDELENISNSLDPVCCWRSKRALAVVEKLKKSKKVKVLEISNVNSKNEKDTARIINLAKSLKAEIITKNFGLYREAFLQNINVLNINNLEIALYPVFLPGEQVHVYLVKNGAQHNQAVGYFDDKTMIIAKEGKNFIGKNVVLSITSVTVGPTGKIIFGKIIGQLG